VQGHEDGAGAVVDSSDNGDVLDGNVPQSTAGAFNEPTRTNISISISIFLVNLLDWYIHNRTFRPCAWKATAL
jgi:hypothetical protein